MGAYSFHEKQKRDNYENEYRQKLQKDQYLKELEHKKRDRERKQLIEQFESSNRKTGSKLEEIRKNIAQ